MTIVGTVEEVTQVVRRNVTLTLTEEQFNLIVASAFKAQIYLDNAGHTAAAYAAFELWDSLSTFGVDKGLKWSTEQAFGVGL